MPKDEVSTDSEPIPHGIGEPSFYASLSISAERGRSPEEISNLRFITNAGKLALAKANPQWNAQTTEG